MDTVSMASADFVFRPPPGLGSKRASAASAVFTLVSTIVGGGSLSLPFAFAKLGLAEAAGLLIVIAVASDLGASLLVSAARRSGGCTYEQVAYKAYGRPAQLVTVVLLVVLTYLCCVAYIILMGDFAVPLLEVYVVRGTNLSGLGRALAMGGAMVLVSPLCFLRKLTALRFTSAMSMTSMLFLTCVIVAKAVIHARSVGLATMWRPVAYTSSFADTLYGFPLISVAFLVHFNVLPVHTELTATEPALQRIRNVIHVTVGICSTLYVVIGVAGYATFGTAVDGDVLKNYGRDDHLVNAGRFALLATLLCNFPLLCIPCRISLDRLVLLARDAWCLPAPHGQSIAGHLTPPEKQPLLAQPDVNSGEGGEPSRWALAREDPRDALKLAGTPDTSRWDDEHPPSPESVMVERLRVVERAARDKYARLRQSIETVLIIASSLAFAIAVPSVVIVWSFMGSTISMLIAFVLPALYYLKIRAARSTNPRRVAAVGLLCFGMIMLVACTYQSVRTTVEQES
ncbi:uncharacterized protein AMSG_05486 [Thecamonas trahens ATCC 50062]|uniref:Amino acid transporter transmembrane domain-containing protein n=1 Tax=Thecamonas trahens ATCC 50062 TaxID=461836 RepID=A0A0L0DAW0_THETB|nr:hypothetical protein AMSG_05486 [Thecamonas trahens ATCC 50062]KNC49472.1 hypothetical protein AMSG_05486 [Thecamonas trahens ATCC 50062]|eukprot:XP_013757891.1 hypothetical protein AMSG_05486 [Thecamonas trahens ATCC 50062]